jgi:hypothetical protein
MTTPHHPVVFLIDVDNTLLDNDRVAADLKRYLRARSAPSARSVTGIFEELRAELGYADYPARSSATGSRIRAIRTCSRCRRFS